MARKSSAKSSATSIPTMTEMAKIMVLWVRNHRLVMPGLVPGIHVFLGIGKQVVDGRDKPGHDGRGK